MPYSVNLIASNQLNVSLSMSMGAGASVGVEVGDIEGRGQWQREREAPTRPAYIATRPLMPAQKPTGRSATLEPKRGSACCSRSLVRAFSRRFNDAIDAGAEAYRLAFMARLRLGR